MHNRNTRKRKGQKKNIFEIMVSENFPELMTHITPQTQEVQRRKEERKEQTERKERNQLYT